MRSVLLSGPQQLEIREIEPPIAGDDDIVVRIRACGICGADPHAVAQGTIIPGAAQTALGHEPAGEIVEVGAHVRDLAVGDRVVIDPTKVADAIIGGGGPQGALSDLVAVRGAVAGESVIPFAAHVPWHVAALAEPLAVARRAVDRTHPQPHHTAVVFGAGPVGLGALLALKSYGVGHVVVADIQQGRLEIALELGADAVIDSSAEDVRERLVELQGSGADAFGRQGLPGTDIYIDAAGVRPVLDTVFAGPKSGAILAIVGIHQRPVEVDFQSLIPSELAIVHSMGHPGSEMREVVADIVANTDKYARIVSDLIPLDRVAEAIDLAGRPGASRKVVVTLD
ncbi:alcohol dehydrogenase catalytic domain-containing protein [Microbacterium sp. Sa4CUA7]|uniref:Alcohol dehydrogenase catalytic domain-containing protein n=1 Tax=Microbacterium pullorum TaxID=2762236 RepID=A0ABR8S2T1_9MICO|nr:zinc-binding dehydrogenase [Microbacterium pullorum]MBD7957755.1 alcohol dehydrogenase catalytic domain-containing protein [Microbacterium pullorum]